MWKGHADARPDAGEKKLQSSVPAPDDRPMKGGVDWKGQMDVRPSSAAKSLKKR